MLRRGFEQVEACESHAESAAQLGISPQSAESFLRERMASGARPDLVIANPPRAGLGTGVCEALAQLGPPQLRIMSCSVHTLAEDLRHLAGPEGPYTVGRVRAYDTLPQTAHLEVVVHLRRGGFASDADA